MTLSRPRCEGDSIPRDLQLRLRFVAPVGADSITATLVTEWTLTRPRNVARQGIGAW
jgi:hypothetical protein